MNTDIEFGKNGGLATLLVLTGKSTRREDYSARRTLMDVIHVGITKESEITGPNASPTVPDYVTKSIGDLRALIDE